MYTETLNLPFHRPMLRQKTEEIASKLKSKFSERHIKHTVLDMFVKKELQFQNRLLDFNYECRNIEYIFESLCF
jgi:hypothetical protein